MRRVLLLCLMLTLAPGLRAQEDARVAVLARLLAAEDRRAYDPELFEASLASPDRVVRRQATLGAGRIRDPRAGAPLLALLDLPDTSAHGTAMFALGLLGDTTLATAIIARLGNARPLAAGAVAEAPATLAKLGTGEARTLFSRLLDGTSRAVPADRLTTMLPGLLVEGWRFGRHAPVDAALAHVSAERDSVRWRAAYLLGRTRAAAGTRALLARVRDPQAWVRQFAVRGLTRAAADSARVPRDSLLPVLTGALADVDPGVRVNALLSMASWADSSAVARVLDLLRDPVPNVRLQAVSTLAALGGSRARTALVTIAGDARESLVLQREALIGLLRADTALVLGHARRLAGSAESGERTLAIELAAMARAREVAPFAALLRDPDPGVVAAAMGSLGGLSPSLDAEILGLAGQFRDHPDDRLRAAAWAQLARRAGPGQVALLVEGWRAELARGRRGASGAILAALRRIHAAGGAGQREVEAEFLATATPPPDYLLRRSAANWPALAARWGETYPAEVRHTDAEYRAIASGYLLGSGQPRPRVRIETAGRGVVELELLGDEAPLTVANFLELVEAGFFDGGTWHRVIPNFVVQDGAGRPDNRDALPLPIRDEINQVRYDVPVLGMALSGPDTGTSQWFINLSPQPHLDGGYTVFGRLVGDGGSALYGILQGDLVRSIRR